MVPRLLEVPANSIFRSMDPNATYNDYETPSFYTEDHHSGQVSGPFNKVENSHGVHSSIGFGGSYMLDSGYAGLSFSRFNNDYGVPGEHAESDTLIEMESDRFEFRSELEITDSEWLTGVELNFGYGDYKHSESGFETENMGTRMTNGTPMPLI